MMVIHTVKSNLNHKRYHQMANKISKYSDNYAIKYEYLIRSAHQCGRYGVPSANADIYRRLLKHASFFAARMEALKNARVMVSKKTNEEMLSAYMSACYDVEGYLLQAIDAAKEKISERMREVFDSDFEEIVHLLHKPDIDSITYALQRLEKIFLRVRLFPK